ncbi:hypothetical protein M514_02857 [Trichuris suis]|uniref:Uncharacterized protein n=1 Tax=Trichuris suis TaxID=68888 RepID=A0A085MGQ6_9BILA|nr:hypothetical protein M513_02857 [Trichuris suis]KFD67966.1 hypothetical protein M514_02857 [Trichuris suis]
MEKLHKEWSKKVFDKSRPWGFSCQEYCNGLSFPSPVDHALPELSVIDVLIMVYGKHISHKITYKEDRFSPVVIVCYRLPLSSVIVALKSSNRQAGQNVTEDRYEIAIIQRFHSAYFSQDAAVVIVISALLRNLSRLPCSEMTMYTER